MKPNVKSEIHRANHKRPLVVRPASLVTAVAMLLSAVSSWGETTNAPARLSYDAFRMISDRNIFNPSRYARPVGSRTRTPNMPASRVESFTLVGLMAYEKGVFAFFDGTSPSYRKTLEANGAISDFKITGLTPQQLQLVSGTNEFTLRVGLQVRREDEGEWFVTEPSRPTRGRVAVSRARSRSANNAATGVEGDVFEAGAEGDPEILVIDSASLNGTDANATETNGDGETAPAAESANDSNGITDPVLLRLMQRRQELNQ